jgi:sigma-B regulation protein RsbU (phosphoserine phosphatase)
VVRCIELGAVDYLFKPFNPVLLRARLAATLEKKRLRDEITAHLARLEQEIEAARRLQMAMVPQLFPQPTPACPVDLFAAMEPAREVGGDLYDFFRTENGSLGFLVGDVSGKGMPAALFMAHTKSLIRLAAELMLAPDGGSAAPSDILARVNRELCQNNNDMMFVSLFFAILSPSTGGLAYCNAGHNPPYRLCGTGVAALDDAKGPVLGIIPEAIYVTGHLVLSPGETLYLFTDGVTEANNAAGELFTEERLEAHLRGLVGGTSTEIVNSVTAVVHRFVDTALPFDDITMMAVRQLDGAML